MKLWQVNDCDWWAAETAEEAMAASAETGAEHDDAWPVAIEVPESKWEGKKVYNEDDGTHDTYAESMAEIRSRKSNEPIFFASTEF